MRRATRRDKNHYEITEGLEERGFSVLDLSHVGGGCPDLLVAWAHGYALLEIKTPKGKLNKKQLKFHAEFGGRVYVVRTLVEALACLGVTRV